VTLVDTAMLGPLGATPLAAVSLTTSVAIIFYAGLYGFAGPVGLFAGRCFGSGDLGASASAGGLTLSSSAGNLFVGNEGGIVSLGIAGSYKNTTLRHMWERIAVYEKEQFDFNIIPVQYSKIS
jgi:hypothetical protein